MLKQALIDIFKELKDIQPVGIDGISMKKFKTIIEDELDIMSSKIENETYNFGYYKQKLIVKAKDSTREISIPTLRDKVVINYLHKYLKDAFSQEIELIPSIHNMIHDIKLNKPDFEYFIKTDIQNFYPSIEHSKLLRILEEKIKDKKVLSLIEKAITQTTIDSSTPSKEREKYANKRGVPQGLSISGLLADLYLINFTKKYQNYSGIKFYKFVDDVLILCNIADIEPLSIKLVKDFADMQLTIHPFKDNSKSIIGKTTQIFDFIGYTFKDAITSVREKSTQKMFKNISNIFTKYKHGRYENKAILYQKLNMKITGCTYQNRQYGWMYFFAYMNDYTLLSQLDRFIQAQCKINNILYNEKMKKFSRAIFEVNSGSSYIPDISNYSDKERNRIIHELQKDIDFY